MTTQLLELESQVVVLSNYKCPYASVIGEYWPNGVEKPDLVRITHFIDNTSTVLPNDAVPTIPAFSTKVVFTMKNDAKFEYHLLSDGSSSEAYSNGPSGEVHAGSWGVYFGSYQELNVNDSYYDDYVEEVEHKMRMISECAMDIAREAHRSRESAVTREKNPKKRWLFL